MPIARNQQSTFSRATRSLVRVPIGMLASALLAGVCAQACSGQPEAAPCDVAVDRFKELVVVDESVLAGPRSRNANSGHWSFRYLIEQLAPPGTDPAKFVLDWLQTWQTVGQLNGYPVNRPEDTRAERVDSIIICPWLRRTASNKCDETCGTCDKKLLDLAQAPFRLSFIANRLDIFETETQVVNGEFRLGFALVNGASDDPMAKPLPMTVNFEYALPAAQSRLAWAKRFHALGSAPDFGESYQSSLQLISESVVQRDARGGSALAQIRTNESALHWIWQLREFALDGSGGLRMRAVRNTPSESLNGSPLLSKWVNENAANIRANRYDLPAGLRGPVSEQLVFSWRLAGVDPATENAFIGGTCDGCHSVKNPPVDVGFHISPFRTGAAKLSPYLNGDPIGATDELGRRAMVMQRVLCANP